METINKLYDIIFDEIVEGEQVAYTLGYLITSLQSEYRYITITKRNLINWMENNPNYEEFTKSYHYEMELDENFNQVATEYILSMLNNTSIYKEQTS